MLRAAIAGYRIISCDIFDTAIARTLARPEDALLAVGARARAHGLVSCSPEAFREYRREAERVARQVAEARGHDEVRIVEVYEHLRDCGIAGDPERLAAMEFAVEQSICRPVEAVRDALNARDADQRLLFLSDTMLPGEWLSTLLTDAGYRGDHLVVSSADVRRSKHTGRLFAHLIESTGCAPADIVHIGDNAISDVARAREHGLTAYHLPRPNTPPELPSVAASHFVVRLAHSHRRSPVATDAATSTVANLYRYAAVLLTGFTLFALSEARRRGINRIYFMARDGHLPLAIARRLTERTRDSFDLRYLHASRRSFIPPSMMNDLPGLADQVGRSMFDRPLSRALEFVGIDAGPTSAALRSIGLDPDMRLTGKTGLAPIQRLFEAERAAILDRLEQRRKDALAYLDQADFLVPGPRMVVDLGWRGSTQIALQKLTGLPRLDMFGCYVGLRPEALGAALNPDTATGYLFSFGHPKSVMDTVFEGYILFELFFSAPHGSVLHYEQRNGIAEAVLATEQEPGAAIRRQAFAAIEQGCLREFDALHELLDGAWPDTLPAEAALFDLEPLLTHPTAHEIAAINTIPFVHGIDASRNATPVNPVPLKQLLLDPLAAVRRFENAPWRSGTMRASLPWPIPDMSFGDFRWRVERLRRMLRRS